MGTLYSIPVTGRAAKLSPKSLDRSILFCGILSDDDASARDVAAGSSGVCTIERNMPQRSISRAMIRMGQLIGLLASLTLAPPGCASKTGGASEDPAPDATRVAQIRQDIRATDPGAVVGVVTHVLSSRNYAAVGDMPLADLRVGQPMTFIDSNRRIVTHGIIRRITSTEAHVEFERAVGTARTVRVGDLAVRFKT